MTLNDATWHDVISDPVIAVVTVVMSILFDPLILLIMVIIVTSTIMSYRRVARAKKAIAEADERIERERRDVMTIISAHANQRTTDK